MVREKLVTIIIGLLVGALIAGGLFFGPGLLAKLQHPQPQKVETAMTSAVTPTKSPAKVRFEITSPEDNSSTTDSSIKVKGTATPNAKIIIFSNADDGQILADKNGNFEASVKLEEGENEITVTQNSNPVTTLYRNVTLEIAK